MYVHNLCRHVTICFEDDAAEDFLYELSSRSLKSMFMKPQDDSLTELNGLFCVFL